MEIGFRASFKGFGLYLEGFGVGKKAGLELIFMRTVILAVCMN